ncbi:MAG: peroxiredoxin [Microcoleus sp.]
MTLPVGCAAPPFTTKDTHGNTISLSDFSGKTVILYFYPKDDTPGCTRQAQSFKAAYEEYKDKDLVILGVSRDNEASHQKFTEKYCLPFPLLADVDGTLTKAYDVEKGDYAKRVTFVIDGTGKIIQVYEGENLKVDSHARDILVTIV